MWKLEWYSKPNGNYPVKDLFDSLSSEELLRVKSKLDLLMEFGSELKRPHVGYLRDGIFELRVRCIRKQIRILFFFDDKIIILAVGMNHKEENVPDNLIEKAIEYCDDYNTRKRRK